MDSCTNQTYDEIPVGATLTVTRRLSRADVEALTLVSGDLDPFHLDAAAPAAELIVEAVSAEALVSGILNRRLPGPGTRILAQDLRFCGDLTVGDELVGTVTALEKRPDDHQIVFDCQVRRGDEMLVTGTSTVAAPTTRLRYSDVATPEVILRRNDGFAPLFARCLGLPPVLCGIVHPCDRDALLGPIEAAKRGLIAPVLIGPAAKIRAVAAAEGVDLTPYRIVDVEHSHAAARQAVAMVRAGELDALMKGSLHTDELMAAVVDGATGLRTERRVSHVFVMDVPTYPRLLLLTDAAINIAPTVRDKVDICQNAIDLAQVLGIATPLVAILAAVETVNPAMQATVDAAMLCKMADRGQLTGGTLDGPLAFDNAVSEEAARTKKIVSPVAGRADILLLPDLQAGNMVAKQLQYLAGADSAGIVLGARVPIVLTSRADTVRTRLASTAVMVLVAQAWRRPPQAAGQT
ncbi:bifunctional enoyl-CoA hydratase/phosphate acetyltransferase [uncultured Lamprocystis sp.]|jgi:phosphate acetyltransferase|uniref:bifunctional enoyl-CoA hydratase/phosphate acetyltransferase n=1 Tax=uncultured Lamprocystis sp. TaxID=543132 RepID=UPI0025E9AC58|nr:bifunctional enoyl-CoA hydratase/phosphate acetyltransferase [uncultured Lamprocystis sp.]